jgi:hypothetical protein
MHVFPTWFAPRYTNGRRSCSKTSSSTAVFVALGFLLTSPAFAFDDECGGLKVPGYTAKRIIGKQELRATVNADKERTDEIGREGPIQITELATRSMSVINPKAKTVLVVTPPKRPDAAKQKAPERYTERGAEKDGIVKVTLGVKTPKGNEWMVETDCRVADGIWVARKIKTPQGIMEARQTDIKAETIPASEFEVPSDYKTVKPPAK